MVEAADQPAPLLQAAHHPALVLQGITGCLIMEAGVCLMAPAPLLHLHHLLPIPRRLQNLLQHPQLPRPPNPLHLHLLLLLNLLRLPLPLHHNPIVA